MGWFDLVATGAELCGFPVVFPFTRLNFLERGPDGPRSVVRAEFVCRSRP